jgi:hypothetical protein
MRTQRKWQYPYCTGVSMASPRHWNVVRHIRLVRGHSRQPVYYITGLTRYQIQDRARMNDVHSYRHANLKYHPLGKQLGQKPQQYSNNNDTYKEFWEWADKLDYLKEFKVIMEIQRNTVYIIQQYNSIISLLGQIMHP